MSQGFIEPELYRTIVERLPIACVDLVVRVPGDRVLLVRRRNQPLEGEWYVPGGRILQGESALEAAARKLREEVGIDVEPATFSFVGYTEDVFDRNPFDREGAYHTLALVFEVILPEAPEPVLDAQSSDWLFAEELPERFVIRR